MQRSWTQWTKAMIFSLESCSPCARPLILESATGVYNRVVGQRGTGMYAGASRSSEETALTASMTIPFL